MKQMPIVSNVFVGTFIPLSHQILGHDGHAPIFRAAVLAAKIEPGGRRCFDLHNLDGGIPFRGSAGLS